MICASRVHIFNLCAKRQKKKCAYIQMQENKATNYKHFDYEEERKKESERNLQNKMQNLELQLR